jgi:ferric-dicitrate binding protein FerR (iron transport regulator)
MPANLPHDTPLVKQAIAWMLRLESAPDDGRVRQACERWRLAHPDHERAWQRAVHVSQTVRERFGALPEGGHGPALAALQALPSGRRRALTQLGVVLGTAVGSAWLAQAFTPWQRLLADHSTATGERLALHLPDGSLLQLNTDSAVQLRFDGTQRLVVLTRGEIALTSGRDPGAATPRPLRVRSRDGLFEARGTRFGVRQDGGSTLLSVQEGAVALRPRLVEEGAAPMVARAGTAYTVSAHAVRPAPSLGLDNSGWTDGVLDTRDIRLADFLAEVERYRPGRVVCDPAVAGLRLSGVYRLDDTDHLLALLPSVLPVRLEYRTRYWVRVAAR